MLIQVGLVSQSKRVTMEQLALASAAIQKQVARDFRPIWHVEASVDAFARLDQMPLGYWPIVILDDIPGERQGIHLNQKNREPIALVAYSKNWVLTTSHECLEMLADPSGNRTMAGNSVKAGQGRVQYLVEVCDPSEAARFGYSVNGLLVSDFYTPAFFDPVAASGVRYSFTGAITEPRQVLDGGYLSWLDPQTTHCFRLQVQDNRKQFKDLGPVPEGAPNLRSFTDRGSIEFRMAAMTKDGPDGLLLTAALGSGGGARVARAGAATELDRSVSARASGLQRLIEQLVRTKG